MKHSGGEADIEMSVAGNNCQCSTMLKTMLSPEIAQMIRMMYFDPHSILVISVSNLQSCMPDKNVRRHKNEAAQNDTGG